MDSRLRGKDERMEFRVEGKGATDGKLGGKSWARQVPKMEASAILLSVPCTERVPPLILRLITRGRKLLSAALIVRWRVRLSGQTEPLMRAEFALNRHRVFQEGLAAGQQRPLKLSLGQPAMLRLEVGEVLGSGEQVNPATLWVLEVADQTPVGSLHQLPFSHTVTGRHSRRAFSFSGLG